MSQIRGAIADLPLVDVLDLGSETALPVLSSWYSKQQAFLLAMNKMLDLKPARLEQETRMQKMKKLQEAGQGLYDQESQLQKEMAGRKNQASIENLAQQIFKSKRACSRHAKGTQFQEAVEEMLHPDLSAQEAKSKLVIFMGQVMGEINQIKCETMTMNSEYREAEDNMNRANSEREDLEKSVCNLVKKGFHKASLLHHPDKLGENVTDEQRSYWCEVQLGYIVMLRYANYSRSLLLPH
jgi:hypothetical protein